MDILPPSLRPPAPDKTLAAIVYGLYFVATFTALTMLPGILLACAMPKHEEPIASHRRYLIRTFWIMWVYLLIVTLLIFPLALLGLPLYGLVALWVAVRCAVGATALFNDISVPRPGTWLV